MRFLLSGFFYLGSLLPATYAQTNNPLIGTWEGRNDLGHAVRIEFSQDGYYQLSVEGAWLIDHHGVTKDPIRYQLSENSSPNYKVTLYDEAGQSSCGVLQAAFPGKDQLELAPVLQDDKPDPHSVILLRKLHAVD